ncbi:MAG TPA: RNB domain-containing ribonuclease [Ktedonobacteraceae bacterium]|nr:RNB domain-containing ribonuclease [Ktedonobacteraceae bacterium]
MEEQPYPTFTRAALRETTRIAQHAPTELRKRVTVKGITIDGPYSKDLDDAFWLEHQPHGGYQLHISIADVGSLITPHTTPELDKEAFQRSFTRYYAERNEPMLPRKLSEEQLSLLAGQLRPTMTISLPFDEQLRIGEPQIQCTSLCSERRFHYEEVDEEIKHPRSTFAPMLQDAYRLAWGLLQARRAKGALALYDLHAGWATTEEGSLIRLPEGQRHQAQIIIQEWMILTNQSLALYFAQKGLPALYRNHAAKAIAPERATLLEMITTAVTQPELARLDQVRTTVNLAMERARYAPQVAGHFGLNLPAYLHMTSPLRRYPDLVNQRILHAVLNEEPLPYTSSDLETIAAHINAEEDKIRDAKRAHFLTEYQEPIRRAMMQGEQAATGAGRPLAHLDARTFHSALKMAAEEHALSPGIEQEIYRRFDQQQLSVHDIFTLVFRFQNSGEEWDRVKRAALQWLAQHPHHAISIYQMGQQQHGWEAPHYKITPTGKDHQRIFQASATALVDGQRYHSSLHSAAQKDQAKQHALLEIVGKLANQDSSSATLELHDYTAVPEPLSAPSIAANVQDSPTASLSASSNEKGRLLELAQAQRWSKPIFRESERIGPPHAPIFTIEATMTIEGRVYAATGTGTTKTKAEQEAARSLREQIAQPEARRIVASARADKPAVSILYEMAQKQEINSVSYTYQQSGPPNEATFLCTCMVMTLNGREIAIAAEGKTKKTAAQHAASQAIATLFPSSAESHNE